MTMSVRKIFYKVEKHLLKQNGRAEVSGTCQYRTDSGLSCAVGCLMTDDIYDSSFEGNNLRDSKVLEALTPVVGSNKDKRNRKLYLLRELQRVHDDSPVEDWERNLAQLKLEFDIS
tara:strand:- start:71 stop:418 length:348 start_codon:yes stop_codon:yes gene_type:complete